MAEGDTIQASLKRMRSLFLSDGFIALFWKSRSYLCCSDYSGKVSLVLEVVH